jgi:hypothetical protein
MIEQYERMGRVKIGEGIFALENTAKDTNPPDRIHEPKFTKSDL